MTQSEVKQKDGTYPDIHILVNIVSYLDTHGEDDCGLVPGLEGILALQACSKASPAFFKTIRRRVFRSLVFIISDDSDAFYTTQFLDRANQIGLMAPYVQGLTLVYI
jgi:hypothetical protein